MLLTGRTKVWNDQMMPKMLIICTKSWNRIKLVSKRCYYGQMQLYVSTCSPLRLLYPPGLTSWHSPLFDHTNSAGCCPEARGAEGMEVGQCISYLTCMLSLPLQTHTRRAINEQTCVPNTTQDTHKEQECYIFITDVINTECPKLLWRVLIAQQKRPIRSINQWPHWVTGVWVKRHNNSETAVWAAQQSVNSSLKLHSAKFSDNEKKNQVVDVFSSFITK